MKDMANITVEKSSKLHIKVSFGDHETLLNLKFDFIRQYLKDLIIKRGTLMEFDMSGIHYIDNEIIDTLNFLYRMGKKFNSTLVLKSVEPEVYEMIELAKKYYVFDIKHIETSDIMF
jgi:anti-anti-sigma regulatory factor